MKLENMKHMRHVVSLLACVTMVWTHECLAGVFKLEGNVKFFDSSLKVGKASFNCQRLTFQGKPYSYVFTLHYVGDSAVVMRCRGKGSPDPKQLPQMSSDGHIEGGLTDVYEEIVMMPKGALTFRRIDLPSFAPFPISTHKDEIAYYAYSPLDKDHLRSGLDRKQHRLEGVTYNFRTRAILQKYPLGLCNFVIPKTDDTIELEPPLWREKERKWYFAFPSEYCIPGSS